MKKFFYLSLSLILFVSWLPSASASGKIYNVSTTKQLKDALAAAAGGDEIVLEANATFIGPIILPAKSSSADILIKSSELSRLPAGRISPADASHMPKIVSPGQGESALVFAPGSHNYHLAGLEFAKSSPTAVVYDLIKIGDNTSEQSTLAEVPHDIVLDRVYVHGDSVSDLKRGIGLNSAATTIVNSYISDIHVVGQDAQAIAGFNGPGPFKLINNFLEASTENVMFGGADPVIKNLVPSDIEIRGNLFHRPAEWKTHSPHWVVKNIFELKNARRVTVEGNIFENNWADGQSGYAIVFTPRNQDGNCTWCEVSDVSFRNNIVRNSFRGINILSQDNTNHTDPVTSRIEISNNSFENIESWWILLTGSNQLGPNSLKITHNTVKQGGTVLYTEVSPGPGFVFSDNIANHNEYGIMGDSKGVGDATLNYFFPTAVFTNNVFVGGPAKLYAAHPGNYFPATWDQAAQQYPQLGADMNQLNSALAGSTDTPVTPSPEPSPSPVPVPATVPASDQTPAVASPGANSSSVGNVSSDTAFRPAGRPFGTLFKYLDSPTVYRLENGLKRAFDSLNIFKTYALSFNSVIILPDIETYADGPLMRFADGSLVKGSGPTVYLSQAGQLRPFSSGEKFLSLGYRFNQVAIVSDSELQIPLGPSL